MKFADGLISQSAVRVAKEKSGAHGRPIRGTDYHGHLPGLRKEAVEKLYVCCGKPDFFTGMRVIPAGRLESDKFGIVNGAVQ